MDNLLLPYLTASDEPERQEHLDELIVLYAAPVVRQTLRQKLGFHVNQFGVNPYNPDAEDLYNEIIAKIIEFLTGLAANPTTDIQSFEQYVGRIAANACLDYLRAKSPVRTRLKYSLRELLSRRSEFVLWKSEDTFLCGLAAWGEERASSSAEQLTKDEDALEHFRATRFGQKEITKVPLARVAAELLQWANSPVELDEFVKLIATLLDVRDRPAESLDDEAKAYLEARLTDTALISDPGLDSENLLRALWQAVKALPEKQRDTFSLGFEDDHGEDFFTLLFQSDIATPLQLSVQLGRSLEDLMRLWSLMPMDVPTIAVELNGTRAQVRKWRFDALRRLEKELQPFLRQK